MSANKFLLAAGLAVLLFGGASPVQSQGFLKPTAEQQLKTLKEQNKKLLEQQAATMIKLDEISKNAQQLRTFARRS